MNARLLLAASALPSREGRAVAALLLCSSTPRRARQAAAYKATRDKLQAHFQSALVRVLEFAKHETLRKLHRYMYRNRPLKGADATPDHADASQIAFNVDELRQDLYQMLETQLPHATAVAVEETLNELGYRDPWKLPAQATLDMVAARKNLISGVPDEIFADIQKAISDGLIAGDSVDQLARRISAAFDSILTDRAALIAETETAAAYGFASNAAAEQAGVEYKQWIHAGLPKEPRPDHLDADGLVVPMDEAFPIGDPPLMYPHDPDGSAEDVINCGCISIPATQEDYDNQ